MATSIRRVLLVATVTLALLGAGSPSVVPVTAKAPPEPVCGVCTDALDEAASEHGVVIDRGESTMTVTVNEDATARFVARVTLTSGAERLRNDTLRAAIVRDVSYVLVEDRRRLVTAIEDDTLVVRYRSTDVAHLTTGVIRFDAFETRDPPPLASGGEGTPYPGADRLTLWAPSGFRLHGSHGDFSNASAIVWQGNGHRQFAGTIEEDVVISFVPDDAVFPGLRVLIADLADWVGI
ncbi:MAG: hypothetical protein ABEJ76_09870 [Halanaeroarchaeum sp.]